MASSKKIVTLMLITLVGLAFTGCGDSGPVGVAAVDTAPPAVPANLDVQYTNGAATISWAANTVNPDLAGFIVSRERNGASEALVSSPAMITSYTDPSPLFGSSTYHVYAVDLAGNQSAVSSTNLTISGAHRPGHYSN